MIVPTKAVRLVASQMSFMLGFSFPDPRSGSSCPGGQEPRSCLRARAEQRGRGGQGQKGEGDRPRRRRSPCTEHREGRVGRPPFALAGERGRSCLSPMKKREAMSVSAVCGRKPQRSSPAWAQTGGACLRAVGIERGRGSGGQDCLEGEGSLRLRSGAASSWLWQFAWVSSGIRSPSCSRRKPGSAPHFWRYWLWYSINLR